MKAGAHFNGKNSASPTDWQAQTVNLLSRPLIIGLLLAVVTLIVYWPARQYDFLGYDDPLYFSENVHVQAA